MRQTTSAGRTQRSRPRSQANSEAGHSAISMAPPDCGIDFVDSAPQVAQRQLTEEEEELMQGRFIQRQEIPEEEELMQGWFQTVQRQGLEEEELMQGRFETAQRQPLEEDEDLLQGRLSADSSPIQLKEESAPSPNQTGMPDSLKAGVESLSRIDMSDVRVHYHSSKPARVKALAYARGRDIYLSPGQDRHLPHEAWHVVQQRQARVRPTIQVGGQQVNDDARLEKEADVMGATALRMRRADNATVAPIAKRMKNTGLTDSRGDRIDQKGDSSGKGKGVVAQLRLVNATDTHGYRWRSTEGFDDKHLGPAPTTPAGWVQWRAQRWPGFGVRLPGSTLVTGNLSTELAGGHYTNYATDSGRFTVDVACACSTINPLHTGSALTVNNYVRSDYNNVELGGWDNPDGSAVIDHLARGF